MPGVLSPRTASISPAAIGNKSTPPREIDRRHR
jgi:hypothetical protein